MEKVKEILSKIASQHVPGYDWLANQLGEESNFVASDFYLSFNLIHRKIADEAIPYSSSDIQELEVLYPGFLPRHWNTRAISRALMVLSIPDSHRRKVLDDLFATGDIQELETLYRVLYLLPDSGNYGYRGAEGIRTNMTRVFDALALDNPFPAEYMDEGPWNQMVLKAIFMQRPLYRIVGLDDRLNEDLARIASDFAHERWAASRTVTPELWRLLTAFKSDERMSDIKRVYSSDDLLESEAGKLVLTAWGAHDLLDGNTPEFTWNELGKKLEENELY
jgi:hypothetical protein